MNIANKLTFFRVIVVPFIVVFFVVDTGIQGIQEDFLKIAAAVLFILGAISDGMDGYYARKYGMTSNFGKLWDPIADKILVSSTLICLLYYKMILPYTAIIIISREFFVSGLRLVSIEQGKVIAASRLGKWKTTFQLIHIITLLVFVSFEICFLRFLTNNHYTNLFNANYFYIIRLLEGLSIFFTVYSGLDYYIKNRKIEK
ncbi:MAG: CDP-diacylglycerol--glycerol-3-phosphate 3-phosphatidyltransferase [Candidatus Muiribacterium halophilum]|uniref:CDP-diacylglycerol--glycerol-3-phosphate 3-phosphatidyltransferase n=1 Tax=Muiribacterium halophilum TaxID=2053465 RepID=A0A2N5ZAY3_MUIH1|nr:MAG: CDP-diacylglycerol--glycerol-3-phosphate 3-phosphatidyltransferase [Candidatus Muirbacterium halophilum]